MKLGKIAGTAFMAIAAVGIAAGTAHAQPAQAAEREIASGTEQGITYSTVVSDANKEVTSTVEGARYELAGDVIALKSDEGAVVGEVPLTLRVKDATIEMAHEISSDGHSLTMTPEADAEDIAELKSISSMDRLVAEANKNIVGVIVGGLIGSFIGSLLGFGIFSIITWIPGMIVGAAIGGGPGVQNALMAVLTGQP